LDDAGGVDGAEGTEREGLDERAAEVVLVFDIVLVFDEGMVEG
jgi:hypothetical protein